MDCSNGIEKADSANLGHTRDIYAWYLLSFPWTPAIDSFTWSTTVPIWVIRLPALLLPGPFVLLRLWWNWNPKMEIYAEVAKKTIHASTLPDSDNVEPQLELFWFLDHVP